MEKITCDEAALSRIASLARGGLRDAEGLLDQAVNLSQGNVTDAIVRELSGAAPDEVISEMLMGCAAGKTADVLAKAHQTLEAGADPEDLLTALSERLRGALLCQVCGENTPLLEGQAHLKTAYAELSKALSADQIMMLVQLFTAARRQMRDAAQTRLPLEMALIRACRAGDLVELGKLVGALESAGGPAAVRPQPAPHPPNREGFRPNSPGRPAGTVESRPAAPERPQTGEQKPALAVPVQAPAARPQLGVSGLDAEVWAKVVGAVAREKGGGLLVSALSHAQAARFDDAASALTLGFAASQLFYRDQLEKPQNQTMLLAVLKGVLARDVTLVLERVAATAAASRPAAPVPRPPSGSAAVTPSRAVDEAEIEESSAEETEVEFDGVGELPLPAAPAPEVARPAAKADDVDGEDAPPRAPVVAVPKVRQPALDPRDRQAFEAHPLVQTVLREVGGRVVNVIRK
jgi:DNA polymerase-3 subunit gamma/tau